MTVNQNLRVNYGKVYYPAQRTIRNVVNKNNEN